MKQPKLLVLVSLFVLSMLVRLPTFERFLPVADYPDELNMYMLALSWRGGELAEQYGAPYVGEWLAHYPPLYVGVNALTQDILDSTNSTWKPVGAYLSVLRLLSVIAGAVTALFVALAAWELGGVVAGWLAGLVWALVPAIYETGNLAIPDSFVYPACAIALALALLSWRRQSPILLLGSLIAAIAAIYFKYTPVYALLPWVAASLLLLKQQPRRMFPWLVAQGILGLAAAAYLVFGYDAFALANGEAKAIRSGDAALLDWSRFWNNAGYSFIPIGGLLFVLIVVGGSIAYLFTRRRVLPLGWIALLIIYAVSGIVASAATSTIDKVPGTIRHVLPAALVLIIIWALFAKQIVRVLHPPALRAGLIILLTLAISLPALGQSADLIARFNLPDSRLLLWRWADTSVPPEGMILSDPRSAMGDVWNRPWRGYDGATAFQWWQEEAFWQSSPEMFAQRGIRYFVVDEIDRDRLKGTQQMEDWVAQLMHLKTFPASQVSPRIDFYRMLPPQVATSMTFDDQIELVGYDLDLSDMATSGHISIRPYWRALRLPEGNYSLFVHLLEGSTLVAQYDGAPINPQRLTLTWDDPNEVLIGALATLTLPTDVAARDYLLAFGLYDFTSGERLNTPAGDSFPIPISIVP